MVSPAADLPMLPALTDAGFGAATAVGVVLVLFTASWCQPCARAGVAVAGLARDLRARRGGPRALARAVVVTADIDVAPHAAGAAALEGVPALVMYRDGVRVGVKIGDWPRAALIEWCDAQVENW